MDQPRMSAGTTAREYTVDDLARAADTLTTTVRMYQAKGLLHAPQKRGRKAVYDDSHLDRIRLITDLQQRGHSLAGIADLLAAQARGGGLGEILGTTSWPEPEPLRIPAADLVRRLGGSAITPATMTRAVEAGLVEFDDEFAIVADRRFLLFGERLVEMGVPADRVLDEWFALRASVGSIAERFVSVFDEFFLRRLDGAPLDEIGAVLDRLRDTAQGVTSAALDAELRDRATERLHRYGRVSPDNRGQTPPVPYGTGGV